MLDNLIRSVANGRAALAQGWDKVQLFFLTQTGTARRNSERLAALQHEEREAERLDRLRNPGDYQGR